MFHQEKGTMLTASPLLAIDFFRKLERELPNIRKYLAQGSGNTDFFTARNGLVTLVVQGYHPSPEYRPMLSIAKFTLRVVEDGVNTFSLAATAEEAEEEKKEQLEKEGEVHGGAPGGTKYESEHQATMAFYQNEVERLASFFKQGKKCKKYYISIRKLNILI